jgi:hypothetical protein
MKALEDAGQGNFLELTPAPVENLGGVDLEDATLNLNPILLDIKNLVEAGYGSYLEVAYEWTFEEAQDILEILDIQHEYQKRDSQKKRSEDLAKR